MGVDNRSAISSIDGINWSVFPISFDQVDNNSYGKLLAYGNNKYLYSKQAITTNQIWYTSSTLVNWRRISSNPNEMSTLGIKGNIKCLINDGNKFICSSNNDFESLPSAASPISAYKFLSTSTNGLSWNAVQPIRAGSDLSPKGNPYYLVGRFQPTGGVVNIMFDGGDRYLTAGSLLEGFEDTNPTTGNSYVNIGSRYWKCFSNDGYNWKSVLFEKIDSACSCFGNNKFVEIGRDTNNDVRCYVINSDSSGNINYTKNLFPYFGEWNGGAPSFHIAYGNGKFVAVSTESKIAYSSDGVNWTVTNTPVIKGWIGINFLNGVFIINQYGSLSEGSDRDTYLYSTDGINWSVKQHIGLESYVQPVQVSNNRFVIFGNNKNIDLNTANYNLCADWDGQDGNVTTVGSNGGPSAYGTYDQTGNVIEWTDTLFESRRILRGGFWNNFRVNLNISSSNRIGGPEDSAWGNPTSEFSIFGFRVASKPNINTANFVNVGNIGNPNDSTGYGQVLYEYNISQYSVTNCEYVKFLNSVASIEDTYNLYKQDMGNNFISGINRSGSPGSYTYSTKNNKDNKPVVFVSWFDAARYCNWLHNGKPSGPQDVNTTEDGAYTLAGLSNISRNIDAIYWIPNENEWYKAAYYDPSMNSGSGGYWKYATQSDNVPTCVSADPIGNGPLISNYACPTEVGVTPTPIITLLTPTPTPTPPSTPGPTNPPITPGPQTCVTTKVRFYTIELVFRVFIDPSVEYGKLIDFNNRTKDFGLYIFAGDRRSDRTINQEVPGRGILSFLPMKIFGSSVLEEGVYNQVILTRDPSEKVEIYLNKIKQFEFYDYDKLAIINTENLSFFIDDLVSNNQNYKFYVSKINLYPYAKTFSEIENMNIFHGNIVTCTPICPETPYPQPTPLPEPLDHIPEKLYIYKNCKDSTIFSCGISTSRPCAPLSNLLEIDDLIP